MFVCERPSLLAAVEAVAPLVGETALATIEVTEPDVVTVTAVRPGRGARAAALGRVLLAGSVTLPLGPLLRALRCGTGRGRCEVAANATTAALVLDPEGAARKFTFDVPTAADELLWPTMPADAATATVPATAFARMVARVAFAADARSPFANGWECGAVQFGIAPKRVTCAATDGAHLATATNEADAAGQRTQLVPLNVAQRWAKAARVTESIRLTLANRTVLFECGPSLSAWADPVAGTFPDWQTGMPQPAHTVTVPTERFRVELAAAVAMSDKNNPRIVFATRSGGLTLTTTGATGRVTLTVPVPGFKGPAVQVPVDGRRLRAIVGAFRSEPALTIGYTSGAEPITVSAGADCLAVLVPMVERGGEPSQASHRVTLAKAS